MVSCSRCDKCFKVGVSIVLVETFMWTYCFSCSIWPFWKAFIVIPKIWIGPNLCLRSFWCEYSKLAIFFFGLEWYMSNVQWAMYWPMDLNPMFKLFVMCLTFWVHETSKVGYVRLWDLWKTKELLNLDIHENKIAKSILWAFGFGGAYVCKTILYHW